VGARALAREMGDIFLHGVLQDNTKSKIARHKFVRRKNPKPRL
jgi:hypothetical protein